MGQSWHNTWHSVDCCAKNSGYYLFTLFTRAALLCILLTKNCHSTLYSNSALSSNWSIKILHSQPLCWKLSGAITWPLHSTKHVSNSSDSVVLWVVTYLPYQCVQILLQQSHKSSCQMCTSLRQLWAQTGICGHIGSKSQSHEHVVRQQTFLWWLCVLPENIQFGINVKLDDDMAWSSAWSLFMRMLNDNLSKVCFSYWMMFLHNVTQSEKFPTSIFTGIEYSNASMNIWCISF